MRTIRMFTLLCIFATSFSIALPIPRWVHIASGTVVCGASSIICYKTSKKASELDMQLQELLSSNISELSEEGQSEIDNLKSQIKKLKIAKYVTLPLAVASGGYALVHTVLGVMDWLKKDEETNEDKNRDSDKVEKVEEFNPPKLFPELSIDEIREKTEGLSINAGRIEGVRSSESCMLALGDLYALGVEKRFYGDRPVYRFRIRDRRTAPTPASARMGYKFDHDCDVEWHDVERESEFVRAVYENVSEDLHGFSGSGNLSNILRRSVDQALYDLTGDKTPYMVLNKIEFKPRRNWGEE